MEKFNYGAFDPSRADGPFMDANTYTTTTNEIDNRKQHSYPFIEVRDFINNLIDKLEVLFGEITTNIQNLISGKVDKVAGSSLMTNSEHTKLAGIEEGANKYVLPSDVVHDSRYVHTDNNYTTTEKSKLATLKNYDDTTVKKDIADLKSGKVDKVAGKGLFSGSYNDLSSKPSINGKVLTGSVSLLNPNLDNINEDGIKKIQEIADLDSPITIVNGKLCLIFEGD